MFSFIKICPVLQRIIFIVIIVCLFNVLSKAQSIQADSNSVKAAVEESSDKVMEIAKLHVQEQAKLKMNQQEEKTNEGILSVLNKTIEELERRAEKQYQNNRCVSIKKDLE